MEFFWEMIQWSLSFRFRLVRFLNVRFPLKIWIGARRGMKYTCRGLPIISSFVRHSLEHFQCVFVRKLYLLVRLYP